MKKHYNRLTTEERHTLEKMHREGYSQRAIARALRRSPATISRELARNTGLRGYRHQQADHFCRQRAADKPKQTRLTSEMLPAITRLLSCEWSPEQISQTLRRQGHDCVSAETIYQWLRSDKRYGGTWYQHLRRPGKPQRCRVGTDDGRRQNHGRASIEERPAAVESREEVGHWEAGTMYGSNRSGFFVTLVERKTGLILSAYLKECTKEATGAAIVDLLHPFREWTHTITFDNGKEFYGHRQIAEQLDCKTYFARPYHSWERGTNENTNGLLRQYFPKKQPLNEQSRQKLPFVIHRLNQRPRKRLGFRTPAEVFSELTGVDYNSAMGVAPES